MARSEAGGIAIPPNLSFNDVKVPYSSPHLSKISSGGTGLSVASNGSVSDEDGDPIKSRRVSEIHHLEEHPVAGCVLYPGSGHGGVC